MLQAFYEKIADQRHGGASKLKSDATYFTIADGIVQHMSRGRRLASERERARPPMMETRLGVFPY